MSNLPRLSDEEARAVDEIRAAGVQAITMRCSLVNSLSSFRSDRLALSVCKLRPDQRERLRENARHSIACAKVAKVVLAGEVSP